MTIYELKKLSKANGGHFFDRSTMAHYGDTLRNFRVKKYDADRVAVYRRGYPGELILFSSKTGRQAN